MKLECTGIFQVRHFLTFRQWLSTGGRALHKHTAQHSRKVFVVLNYFFNSFLSYIKFYVFSPKGNHSSCCHKEPSSVQYNRETNFISLSLSLIPR